MRRDPHPGVAFGQRRAGAPKRPALEHRQIALDQSSSGARRRAAEISLLDQNDP
jgi:hypothetical protein